MGYKDINTLATELRRRIEQLDLPTSELAIHRALMAVHDSGSYTFDLTGTTSGLTISSIQPGDEISIGIFTLPGDCDTRKAMFVANTTGIPLFRTGITKLYETFALGIPTGEGFGTYTISGRTLLVRPGQVGTIGVRYHILFSPPAGNTFTRLSPNLDELVVDLAEAKERQIYSVGDVWFKQWEMTMAQIQKALDGYLSVSLEQMPLMEAAQAAHEATQIGRA